MNRALWLIGGLILILVLLVGIPLAIQATGFTDLYYTLTLIALLSIASAGVWITFYIGRINIGQAAYALIGGYTSAILVADYGWSFWLSLPVAGLIAAAISLFIGLPILRLRGVYFAMVTLVSTEVARLAALALPITNGARGMSNLPLPGPIAIGSFTIVPDFGGFQNPNPAFYTLAMILMLLVFAGVYRLVHSRIGRLFSALQQNEELASSVGVNTAWLRIIAYAISSFLGGLAGATFAAVSQSIYPNSFTTQDSINFMLNCFLGGLGYVIGPLVGTFVLQLGWNLLFQAAKFQELIYAAVLIALMLVLPNGLLSLLAVRFRKGPLMAEGILQVAHLTKRYGGLVAVNDVSFNLMEQEILSVIGPNGAGKSTLFKLIASFVKPSSGKVIYNGQQISGRAPHLVARLGVVRTFQEATIFKNLSVRDSVIVAHHLRSKANLFGFYVGSSAARNDEAAFGKSADEILDFLGLGGLRNEQASALPQGHLRALGIAIGLATNPKVLLLDEPFAGMNHDETMHAVDLVRGVRDRGVTVMLVEHDMPAVMKISDRIVVLNFGQKIAEGTPAEIQKDEKVIEAYLGVEDETIGM